MAMSLTPAKDTVIDLGKDSNGIRKFTCKTCSRSFKRSEHCARHQRGHTQEKPYSCRYCRKKYSRKDLVVRHERTLHAEEYSRPRKPDKGPKSRSDKVLGILDDIQSDDGTTLVSDEELQSDNDDIGTFQNPHLATHDNEHDNEHVDDDTIHVALPIIRLDQSIANVRPFDEHEVPPADSVMVEDRPVNHDLRDQSMSSMTIPLITQNSSNRGMMEDDSVALIEEPSLSFLHGPPSHSENFPLPDLGVFDDVDLPGLDFFDPYLNNTFEGFSFSNMPEVFSRFSPLETITAINTHENVSQNAGLMESAVMKSGSLSQTSNQSSSPRPIQGTIPQSTHSDSTSSIRMPQVTRTPMAKQTSITFTEPMRVNLLVDLRRRLVGISDIPSVLPSAGAMQKCLRSYVDAFHIHLPLLHLHSLDFMRTPSPLILAMASIGALYRLERRVANQLFIKAVQALNNEDSTIINLLEKMNPDKGWREPQDATVPGHSRPLWVSQTRYLTIFYSSFSGEPLLAKKSLEDLGYLSVEYRDKLPHVTAGSSDKRELEWCVWVERESTKRLLYGILILSNLLTITYGVPPAFSMLQDGVIEMPDDDSLWDASTAGQWHSVANCRAIDDRWTLKEALTALMYADIQDEFPEHFWKWSPFAAAVIMHSVSISIWFALFSTSLLDNKSMSSSVGTPDVRAMAKSTEAALNRCRDLLVQARSEQDHPWSEVEGPLLFNAFAVLRVCYSRAFTSVRLVDRMMLLKEDRQDILFAIRAYVEQSQERSDFITRAVSRTLEGIAIPFKSGALLVQKTAALTWSIEHALAGWDAALLVSKWTYWIQRLQHKGEMTTSSETGVLQEVYSILREGNVLGTSDNPQKSLAAELTRLWAAFYDDTWVWGVTPRIGWVLKALADEYQRRWDNGC